MKTLLLSALTNILTKLADPNVTAEDAHKYSASLSNLNYAGSYMAQMEGDEPAAPVAPAAAAKPAKPAKATAPAKPAAVAAPAPAPTPEPEPEPKEEEEEEVADLTGGGEAPVTKLRLNAVLGAGIIKAKAAGLKQLTWVGPAGKIIAARGATNTSTLKPEFYTAVHDELMALDNAPSEEEIEAQRQDLISKGQTE